MVLQREGERKGLFTIIQYKDGDPCNLSLDEVRETHRASDVERVER